MTTTITKINIAKALDNSANFARENLKDKVPYVKGIQYNPKKVKLSVTKAFVETMSQVYAFKSCVYNVDAKSRNNIAYHSTEIEKLIDKDVLTPQEQARLELHKSDRAKTQAGLRHYTKCQKATIQPILDDIATRLYTPYVNRQKDRKGWEKALNDYFASWEMTCDKTVVTFLSDNVGSRLAKVKDWHAFMVDNMVVNAFADLVLACLLQLCIDKSVISMKIVESTLDGAKMVECEETDNFVYIKALSSEVNTIADYVKVLTDVGAEMPKAKDGKAPKKSDYVKAYNAAKRTGLFVEYKY